ARPLRGFRCGLRQREHAVLLFDSNQIRTDHDSAAPVCGVLTTSIAGVHLAGLARDELVQRREFVAFSPQNATQALHVFTHRAAAADDDGDAGVGHVYALVQDLGGGDRAIATVREALQDFTPLFDLGLMRDDRNQEAFGDGVRGRVVLREDQRLFVAMRFEQAFDVVELRLRAEGEFALPAIGAHRAKPRATARGAHDEVAPTARTA